MIDVFPAVEAHYESHPVLYDAGRILREGAAGKEHPPFTLLAGTLDEDLSTFGTDGVGLDVERWTLIFQVSTKTFLPGDARKWAEAMRDVFHDREIIDPFFKTAGCRLVSVIGPENEDEQFKATAEVELTISYDSIRPRVRA